MNQLMNLMKVQKFGMANTGDMTEKIGWNHYKEIGFYPLGSGEQMRTFN